jgi:hypothetical protein
VLDETGKNLLPEDHEELHRNLVKQLLLTTPNPTIKVKIPGLDQFEIKLSDISKLMSERGANILDKPEKPKDVNSLF